jgi:hypothetical protein
LRSSSEDAFGFPRFRNRFNSVDRTTVSVPDCSGGGGDAPDAVVAEITRAPTASE